MSTKFPIDFDQYHRGDVIKAEVIEHAYGVKRDDVKKFSIAKMKMRSAAQKAFRQRGDRVSIRQSGDELLILDHAAQQPYTESGMTRKIAGFARQLGDHAAIDTDKLPDDAARSRHARVQITRTRALQGFRRGYREAAKELTAPTDTKRLTPPRVVSLKKE